MANMDNLIDALIGPSDTDADIQAMTLNLDPKDPDLLSKLQQKINETAATPLDDKSSATLGDAMKLQGRLKTLQSLQRHYTRRFGNSGKK